MAFTEKCTVINFNWNWPKRSQKTPELRLLFVIFVQEKFICICSSTFINTLQPPFTKGFNDPPWTFGQHSWGPSLAAPHWPARHNRRRKAGGSPPICSYFQSSAARLPSQTRRLFSFPTSRPSAPAVKDGMNPMKYPYLFIAIAKLVVLLGKRYEIGVLVHAFSLLPADVPNCARICSSGRRLLSSRGRFLLDRNWSNVFF